MWDLVPWPGVEPTSSTALEGGVLATGPPGPVADHQSWHRHSRAKHLDTLKPLDIQFHPSPAPPHHHPPPPPPGEWRPNSNLHEVPPSVMQRNNGGSAFSKANTENYPCSTIVEQPWQNGSCLGIGGGEGQEVIFFSGCSLCSLCWLWGWFLRCVHMSTLIKLYT